MITPPPPLTTTFASLQDDYLVSRPVQMHLAKYDKQLKKFSVSKALDTALEVTMTTMGCWGGTRPRGGWRYKC